MTDSEMRRLCFAVQKVLRAGRDETAMFVDRDDVSGFASGGRGREPAFLVFSCWSRGRYSKILSELSLFAGRTAPFCGDVFADVPAFSTPEELTLKLAAGGAL